MWILCSLLVLVVASVVAFMVVITTYLILDDRTRRKNDKLLDYLHKEESFETLWRTCEAIGLMTESTYTGGETRCVIYPKEAFKGRVSKTVSWKQLAITIGSFLASGKFTTEKEMPDLAQKLGEFYDNDWDFLVTEFAPEAGRRYIGTAKESVIAHLREAFHSAQFNDNQTREQGRIEREKQKSKRQIRRILQKTHRISKSTAEEII
ncbi:hypothetical protein IT398_02780 [Candidatus Nomurabacteria bacterium]|nr:hypothetical protein [Candidatus Nomurabacteria bacterium]